MSSASSKKVVYAAIFANLGIACTKFIAALLTNSSAMISEAIHSVVDTGNQLLLLLGLHRSLKPADAAHPFGYGKERYFWGLMVAVFLFTGGGAMAIYEGISHLSHPLPLQDPTVAYAVLVIALFFEGYSWVCAWRELMGKSRERSLWRAIRTSKEITSLTVLLEDSAALAGLVVAFLGVFLGHHFGNPLFDGAASLIIGGMLCVVAVILVIECRDLLLGESADPETVEGIRTLALNDPSVTSVVHILTMHFGPQEVLLNLEVRFRRGQSAEDLVCAVDRLEKNIKQTFPQIRRVFIEAATFAPG